MSITIVIPFHEIEMLVPLNPTIEAHSPIVPGYPFTFWCGWFFNARGRGERGKGHVHHTHLRCWAITLCLVRKVVLKIQNNKYDTVVCIFGKHQLHARFVSTSLIVMRVKYWFGGFTWLGLPLIHL